MNVAWCSTPFASRADDTRRKSPTAEQEEVDACKCRFSAKSHVSTNRNQRASLFDLRRSGRQLFARRQIWQLAEVLALKTIKGDLAMFRK